MRTLTVLLLIIVNHSVLAQDWPKELTPAITEKIKKEIEAKIPAEQQRLKNLDFTKDEIEFSLDTFRINELMGRKIDIDYSTAGMNNAVIEQTEGYDKLLNKYYNKLVKLLTAEDKKVLLAAQKAWLAYRDAEANLMYTMTKDEYSGGGTIQSNFRVAAYFNMVEERSIAIFQYYNNVIKKNKLLDQPYLFPMFDHFIAVIIYQCVNIFSSQYLS